MRATFTIFTACFFSMIFTDTSGQKLKIGINTESPPFFFLTEGVHHHDTVGLEYRLAIGLAKYLATAKHTRYYYPEFVNIKSPEQREKLLEHQLDYIIDRYSVTDKRKETVTFSLPYHVNNRQLGMLQRKEKQLSSIGYLRGSTADDFFKEQIAKGKLSQNITLVNLTDQKELLRGFFKGSFDAIVDDYEFLRYWNAHTVDFTFMVDDLTEQGGDEFAIAISKKHIDDLPLVNKYVESIRAYDSIDGEIIATKILNADIHKPPIPGIIEYPKGKDYSVIIPFFLGMPILVTVLLIFAGNMKLGSGGQKLNFELSDEPTNFAWIIANSKYEHKKGLSGQPYSDAAKLKDALKHYGFPETHIAIQKDATRKGILKTFQDIASGKANGDVPFSTVIQPKDNLVIYYSGHGDKIQIGQSQIGFWIPVDGDATWEFIPDYELKAMISLIEVSRILIIADSCFSGSLLNRDQLVNGHDAQEATPIKCCEIITAGNNRVPSQSLFLEKIIELFTTNPRDSLTSAEIYNYLASELTNHRHYQPQFGSLLQGTATDTFQFRKPAVDKVQPKPSPEHKLERAAVVLGFFSTECRFISYMELRAASQLDAASFSELIRELQQKNLIKVRSDNSIFITQNGLSYGK